MQLPMLSSYLIFRDQTQDSRRAKLQFAGAFMFRKKGAMMAHPDGPAEQVHQ